MGSSAGIVYLVGAGPGDPGLLTRRGADVLARAEVVVYDHLANPGLLRLAPRGALLVCAGKSSGHCTLEQSQINDLLAEHASDGRTVVRLKGGDPFVFGRGGEEAEHLARLGVRFEVVPGVTAGIGAAAYAGIPVTHRAMASAVAFVTGHNDPEAAEERRTPDAGKAGLDWEALARFPGTLVVYMGVTRLPAIARTLLRHGKDPDTPAAVVQSGTTASQRVVTGSLATIAEEARRAAIRPPALLVVGQVVGRREAIAWFESLPLSGQRIVVTRPEGDAARSAAMLEAMGAEALIAPTIEVGPMPEGETGPLDAAISRLAEYDWLVFTSANGVRFFLDRLLAHGRDLRALGSLSLAAIGPATAAALESYHLRADLIPAEFRSEALAQALAERAAGCRILLARADRGRVVLREELSRLATVDQVAVYRNGDASVVPAAVLDRIAEGSVDWITLSSSAMAERLHGVLPEEARARIRGGYPRLASISPVTSGAIARLGWPVAAEASTYTWDGLVQAIVAVVSDGRQRPDLPPPVSAAP
ncbi:Uroporphyrinogen-III C-methyltransferase [Aquisphaera giovannonii]|uniref:uroporphyrinogen-III C-methyltransferase n=1 Tax=Aquisphaera giovannonii TaxID=406548 RepID=A0A5B9VXV7_9BACT|nr:uroporphyrinogen-III C-methyltransferase [Aquisphaera giovannonii]QEH33216.1 Uroporphyrinogen-III C-methyltransferase [Aquisphaera giovannonii]